MAVTNASSIPTKWIVLGIIIIAYSTFCFTKGKNYEQEKIARDPYYRQQVIAKYSPVTTVPGQTTAPVSADPKTTP